MRRMMAWLVLAAMCLCVSATAEDRVTITFGGDCVLGTREEWKGQADTFDAVVSRLGTDYPFGGVAALFQSDDWTVVNLECVLASTNRGHDSGKQHTFRGDPAYALALPAAGIEMVSLANNHVVDYGRTGRRATQAALDTAGVRACGYGDVAAVELNGHLIGFAGCRETVWLKSRPTVYREIQALRDMGCEAVVYFCHWGKEYSEQHNAVQQRMAEYAVRSGADLIIGTHPHVPQGVSVVEGCPVVWSLGNLVFGGTHDLKSFDGLICQAVLRFDASGYTGCELTLLPVITSGSRPQNDFRPEFAVGEDRTRIFDLVQADSELNVRETMRFRGR